MKLEHHSHSDVKAHPARHFVDGIPVTGNTYWDTYDQYVLTSPACDVTHMMVETDQPDGHRSRIVTMTLN